MLTKETLALLKAPFERKDHEFIRNFVYITEEAITNRLDEVDPNWEFEVLSVDHRDATCIVHGRLDVGDVTREGIGMQKIDDFGEAEKGAATDALKRCARLFGVGRYLLSAPKEAAFDKWLQQIRREPLALHGNPPSDHWASDETERTKVLSVLKELGFTTADEIAKALNKVDRRISDQPINMRLSQTKFESADALVAELTKAFKKQDGDEIPFVIADGSPATSEVKTALSEEPLF